MSLEAIEKVAQAEKLAKEQRSAAEESARKMIQTAEQEGLALLQQVRTSAAEDGKRLLLQAEKGAAVRATEIAAETETVCDQLRKTAATHMEEAVEFIVGRVVKHEWPL